MTNRATGPFDVTLTTQPLAHGDAPGTLARMSLDKVFHGDLAGTSRGEMLSAMGGVKGSAGYVAIERVTGTLHGREGSFVLQHSGTMTRGAPGLVITVVPDSATGQLEGLTGTMSIHIEGKAHSYVFDVDPYRRQGALVRVRLLAAGHGGLNRRRGRAAAKDPHPMPILEVDFVGPLADNLRRSLARRLADAAGAALGSPPRSTWVRVRFVPADEYAENDGGEPGVFPVLVHVLEADPPQGDDLAREAARLTEAIATATGRPAGNVHLIYAPPGRGRVSFGGKLRT